MRKIKIPPYSLKQKITSRHLLNSIKWLLLNLFFFISMLTFAQNNSIDVLKYTIKIKNIDFKKKELNAETQINFRLKNKQAKTISLSLLGFQIENIKLNGINTNYDYDGLKISIPIPDKIRVQDSLKLIIAYKGHPKQDSTWGGFFIEQDQAFNYGIGMTAEPPVYGRAWFPSHDNFTDHALYRFELTCTKDMTGIANGTLEQIIENDSTHTFIWELHDSIPNYLASIAIGHYDEYKDIYPREKDSLPIMIFLPQGMKKNAPRIFRHLKDAMHTFERLFGPYEWERIGYVSTPFQDGAMEHVTNIAYSSSCNSKNCESTLYHELSHHWFGDLVTCAGEKDMWLNEAWASYCEYLFYENVYGFERAQEHLAQITAIELRYAPISDGSYIALNNPPHNLTYGTNIYKKGAMTVHTLRNIMGDSLFFSTIKAYLQYYKYKNTNIKQFQAYIEKASALDLSDYFKNWIDTGGFPDYYISQWSETKENNKTKVKFTIRQNLLQRKSYADNQAIEVLFANTEHKKTIRFTANGQSSSFDTLLSFKPEILVLDPENKVCDAQFSFNTKLESQKSYKLHYGSLSIYATDIKNSTNFYTTFHYTPPARAQKTIQSIPFFWDIASLDTNKQIIDATFEILDPQNHPNLYFRKNDNSEWIKQNNSSTKRGKFEVLNIQNGQYTFGK